MSARATRIHVPGPLSTGQRASLPAKAGAHVARVLRMKLGDALVVFDGMGAQFDARIDSIRRQDVQVQVLKQINGKDLESPLRITLAQGIARGDRMDWVLQKATELGVAAIVPLFTGRTQVRLDEKRERSRMEHWQGVIAAACEQCGRNLLPLLDPPQDLAGWAATQADSDVLRLTLDPEATRAPQQLPQVTELVLAVGPEGGWSASDRDILAAARFSGLRLGPRILRTETAGIAALAALQAVMGDLR